MLSNQTTTKGGRIGPDSALRLPKLRKHDEWSGPPAYSAELDTEACLLRYAMESGEREQLPAGCPNALESAGAGSRTQMSRGTPDFKSGASDQFRHPGRWGESRGGLHRGASLQPRPHSGRRCVLYVPGFRVDIGNRSGPLPWYALKNAAYAFSSKPVHLTR